MDRIGALAGRALSRPFSEASGHDERPQGGSFGENSSGPPEREDRRIIRTGKSRGRTRGDSLSIAYRAVPTRPAVPLPDVSKGGRADGGCNRFGIAQLKSVWQSFFGSPTPLHVQP